MVALTDTWSAIEVQIVISRGNRIVSPAFNAISGLRCLFPAPYRYKGRNVDASCDTGGEESINVMETPFVSPIKSSKRNQREAGRWD
ncbi:hypothetical protein AVEN_108781-1 [Araneus ventricosus]|uniref:Uncharacterized protein n=1 Tax=Araneus ventricosus TaxID=182803 RepID=A0A4Y2G9T9_ARAVE|nr:hypothetical protein AVEN_108781-1 [Araneus ventricosus]